MAQETRRLIELLTIELGVGPVTQIVKLGATALRIIPNSIERGKGDKIRCFAGESGTVTPVHLEHSRAEVRSRRNIPPMGEVERSVDQGEFVDHAVGRSVVFGRAGALFELSH